MKKILFLRNVNASWAVRDRDILREQNQVEDWFVKPSFYLKLSWPLKVIQSDIVFCWFASFAFFPIVLWAKLLGKKIIIVSGGFDAAYAPTVDYGAFTKGSLSKYLRRKLFNLADKVLCVSKANMAETIVHAQVPSEKCEMIYHGFEPLPETITLKPWNERKNQVVLISQCDHTTYYRKGVDLFLKTAELMPDFKFILVGRVHKDLEAFFITQAPENFSFTGFLPFRESAFNNILNESKFIVQLSYYESFGCSVIDGSVMGCYPITTSNQALFEVSHKLGDMVTYGDLNLLKELLLKHAAESKEVQEISRQSFEKFPFELRQRQLLECVAKL